MSGDEDRPSVVAQADQAIQATVNREVRRQRVAQGLCLATHTLSRTGVVLVCMLKVADHAAGLDHHDTLHGVHWRACHLGCEETHGHGRVRASITMERRTT